MKRLTSFRSHFMVAALATGSFFITSCEDKTDAPAGAYSDNAVLISNEGSFNTSNASVSYYNRSNGTVQNGIFSKENSPQVLGDVLQSITVHDNRAYMVMNNSQKIAVANANTFKAEGEISNLVMPRYFTALNNQKGYATEWVNYDGNGRVAVIDIETLAVTKTIEVGVNPEQLVVAGGKLYVGHAGSDFVSVINTATDAIENHVPVTFGPKYLVLDKNNSLWALSTGQKHWSLDPTEHTPGALTKISLSNNVVSSTLTFGSNTASTGKLTINGNSDKLIYGYNGSIYQQDVNATALNTTPLINRSFYGLGVDPATGQIYAGVAPSFTTDGWVVRFNTTGAAIDSVRVGVAPNDFAFR